MCPRCRNDTCLQCYPEEPPAEQPAPAAARLGAASARSESVEDGEEEEQEDALGEEDLVQPSKGSAQHYAGTCRPCLYMNTQVGCRNGADCNFCHVPHKRKRRARPSKATRMQCKQLVAMLDSVYGEDDAQVTQAAENLAADSAYMRSILAAKGRQSSSQGHEEAPAGWDRAARGCASQSRASQHLELTEPQGSPGQWPAQWHGDPDQDDANPVGALSAKQRAAAARQKTDKGAASASSGEPRRY